MVADRDKRRFYITMEGFKLDNQTTSLHPTIDQQHIGIDKSTYFPTLNLRSDYWQVALNKANREKVVFACHVGLYQFTVMPFRLADAPEIFQQVTLLVLVELEKGG